MKEISNYQNSTREESLLDNETLNIEEQIIQFWVFFPMDTMKKMSIHFRALMTKMITALYSLLGKMSLLGLLTGVWITSGYFGHGENQNTYTKCR